MAFHFGNPRSPRTRRHAASALAKAAVGLIAWPGMVVVMQAADLPTDAPEQLLKVAVVQMRSAHDLTDNAARIKMHLRQCSSNGARVVVFPECALSGYFAEVITNLSSSQISQAEAQIADGCREADVYAIFGAPRREGSALFNSAVVISPAGRVLERYDKIHLAESWPVAGGHLSVFKIDQVPCSVIICHDERYPELVRLPVLAGARIVFYISHESGLGEAQKMNPYRAQIQARAVENTIYIVHANAPANLDRSGSHGQSRLIAPDGNVIDEATIFGEDILAATLDLRKATRANSRNSLSNGPLSDWWKEGVRKVRTIDSE